MKPTAHQIATALRILGFRPNSTKGRARAARPKWVQQYLQDQAELKRVRRRRRNLRVRDGQ